MGTFVRTQDLGRKLSKGPVGTERKAPPPPVEKQLCLTPRVLRERPHARVFVGLRHTPVLQSRYLHPFTRCQAKHSRLNLAGLRPPGFNGTTLGTPMHSRTELSNATQGRTIHQDNPGMNASPLRRG